MKNNKKNTLITYYTQQNWLNYYAYDSRKNKTNPFIYNKRHPINDKRKKNYLENKDKNYYFLRNTNKNHILDTANERKKPII